MVDDTSTRRRRAVVAVRPARRAAFALVAVLALVASGCVNSGDDDDDTDVASEAAGVEVRPFEEVQDGEMTFEPDSSDPSRGIFRVTTTEPMICAIVWGTDDSFGRLNNSLDMDGSGIEQHDVFLPDIEPGAEYRYIVQGTTADGTLYRSEPASFVIDAASDAVGDAAGDNGDGNAGATVDPSENLALGAEISDVSSEFSDGFAATNAVDGDTGTEWATSDDGDEGFITLDLGSDQQIGGVEFLTRSMADGSSVTETYTVTIDGTEPLGPFPAGTVADPRLSEINASGRLLRFDIASSTGGNVGAVDIRVYAP